MMSGAPVSIFISYSRTDSKFVDRLEAGLKARGCDPWVDRSKLEGGDEWLKVIQQEIDRRRLCLVVISPEAIASKYVSLEYHHAYRREKKIIPVYFKSIPDEEWPMVLENLQMVDFQKGYDQGFDELLKAIEHYELETLPPLARHPPNSGRMPTPPVSPELFAITQPSPPPITAPTPLASATAFEQASSFASYTSDLPAPLSRSRTKWDPESPVLRLVIGASWVIWVVVICFNYESIGRILTFNGIDSWVWPGLLALSGIGLFFFWGWIVAQHTGEQDSAYWSGFLGVIAITCASDICSALYWVHHSFTPSEDTAGFVIQFTFLLFFGLLPSIIPFILAILAALVSTALGGLIGESLY